MAWNKAFVCLFYIHQVNNQDVIWTLDSEKGGKSVHKFSVKLNVYRNIRWRILSTVYSTGYNMVVSV